MAFLTLTKHHGLGNDFLIAVDPTIPLTPELANRWCDRKRGIGADGLMVAERSTVDPARCTMTLWNADGSRAELSGNGLRCLGQALVLNADDGSATQTFDVATDAGPRQVVVTPDRGADTWPVTVEMGRAKPGPSPWARWDSLIEDGLVALVEAELGVNIGNPHLVCRVDDLAAHDLGAIGPRVEADYPDGLNVELIRVESRSALDLAVWERGVGLTEACGSGACAAVWAANQWGLVDNTVAVTMPGGKVEVDIVDDTLQLRGDATFVAVIEVEAGAGPTAGGAEEVGAT